MKPLTELIAIILQIDQEIVRNYPQTAPLEELGFDSMGMIRLVLLIEETYDIAFLNSDLILSNFSSIENIIILLQKYEVGTKNENDNSL